jgi:hypothetical protein
MTMGMFWFLKKSSIHSMLSRSKWFVGSSYTHTHTHTHTHNIYVYIYTYIYIYIG